jgi:hypothetical protein
MRLLKHTFLALTLALGAQSALEAQSTATAQTLRENKDTIARGLRDAREMLQNNPQAALAKLEELIEADKPEPNFDSEDLNLVINSYDLCQSVAHLYFEAALTARFGGNWEKAADYYGKAANYLVGPAEKKKIAYARFGENIRKNIEQLQELLEADEFKQLKAKDEKDYDNDDYTELEKLLFFENQIVENGKLRDYLLQGIERANSEVGTYNPTPSYQAGMLEMIRQFQDQINKYSGGRGNTAKWVEGVVFNNANYLKGFPSQEDKIAFTYRLIFLSPNSKTAPALLEMLKGNITEAELKRAITPPKKK